jgi:hypothetical protein
MGGNPSGPLTTTNSVKELFMAKANHKTRSAAHEEPIAFEVPLQGSAQLPSGSNMSTPI